MSFRHTQRSAGAAGGKARTALVRAAAVAAVGLFAVNSVPAADVPWNVADGNWADGNNWVGGIVPGSVDPADRAVIEFATAGATAHVNSDVPDVRGVSVKSSNVISVESGGLLTLDINGVDGLDSFRIGDGSAGSVLLLDGGTIRNEIGAGVNSDSDDINVGITAGGVGTLTQSGATSLLYARDVRVGAEGGTGTYTLTDGTAQLNWLVIGRTGGTGTFNLNGGTVLAKYGVNSRLQVGDSNGSTGTFNFTSGLLETTGEINIGLQGNTLNGTGTVTHTGGTLTGGDSLFIGRGSAGAAGVARGYGTYTLGADAASTAVINVNAPINADATVEEGWYVGFNGGVGSMTINGGTLNVVADAAVGYEDRANSNDVSQGSVTQHGGTVTIGRDMRLGYRRGSSGTYTLDGTGELNVGAALYVGENGVDTLGTLNIAGTAKLNVGTNLRLGWSGGRGVVTQTGGSVTVDAARIGQGGGSTAAGRGELHISSGTFTATDNIWIGDAANTDGLVNLSGDAVMSATNGVIIGRNSTVSAIMNQSGGTLNAGAVTIKSAAAATAGEYNLSGGTLNTGNLTNNRIFNYTGGTANLSGALAGTGTTTVAAGLNLTVNSATQGTTNIDGRISTRPNGLAAGVSRIGTITLGAAGKLDPSDNKLITPMAVGTWTGSAYDGVSGMVDTARGSTPSWNGPNGITTSDARAQNSNLVSIGVAKVAQVKGITDTDTATFAGQTVLGSDTIAMVTYGGDATLDGKINIDDYGRIDANVAQSGTVFGWYNGDFNYDGAINIDDYGIIDGNISSQGTAFPTAAAAGAAEGVSAVPEPASLSVLALGVMGLMRRRRAR